MELKAAPELKQPDLKNLKDQRAGWWEAGRGGQLPAWRSGSPVIFG
jgi:hypothetical protein